MPNPHGMPVWYELLSNDADASQKFYEAVIGWTIHPADMGGMDYRMIDAGSHDHVGGLMQLTPDMQGGGATPGWLFYIGVDDVDASVEKIVAHGGGVLMPAIDMAGVGRMAFVHDPRGVPFYVMRGASDEDSTAYDRTGMGKCNWNELVTPDQAAANAFYADVFGWTYPDRMTMPGDMGDYVFVHAAGQPIGATLQANGSPPRWQFYFRTPDIEGTARKIADAGGAVHHGPADVPGGDRIIIASDAHGLMFGAVGAA